jgi:hypothetical protein
VKQLEHKLSKLKADAKEAENKVGFWFILCLSYF